MGGAEAGRERACIFGSKHGLVFQNIRHEPPSDEEPVLSKKGGCGLSEGVIND